MGSQQLLLISLGVILVGISVVVGVDLYTAYMQDQMKDQLIYHVNNFLNDASIYYSKPKEMGGGGRESFSGWTPSKQLTEPEGDFVWESYKINTNKKRAQIFLRTEGKFENNKKMRVYGRIFNDGQRRIMYYDTDRKKWVVIYKER